MYELPRGTVTLLFFNFEGFSRVENRIEDSSQRHSHQPHPGAAWRVIKPRPRLSQIKGVSVVNTERKRAYDTRG
jgi:hypothetical protein